ncbi:hypothetical protein [Helicobacter japonicus]|uniref:hypothetical protein n=1 Tax=Helicobacter japonicus TaxID=425400 RepID=UPI0025B4B35F|nr:hypothetical protein [Helicobacter japonicus]
MFRFVKTKLKQAKLAKKREADKLKDTPQYYPLQLSPSEVEYVRNTLMSAGGGGDIFRIWLWRLYIFGTFTRTSAYCQCRIG